MVTYHSTKRGEAVKVDGRTVGHISSYFEYGELRYRYRPVGTTIFSATAPTEKELKSIIEFGR